MRAHKFCRYLKYPENDANMSTAPVYSEPIQPDFIPKEMRSGSKFRENTFSEEVSVKLFIRRSMDLQSKYNIGTAKIIHKISTR